MFALGACTGVATVVPRDGQPVAEAHGLAVRVRVYALPEAPTPTLPHTLMLYVELKNRSDRSLRVSYADLSLSLPDDHDPGHGQRTLAALRPGDVLRPGRLGRTRQRLYASIRSETLFGRSGTDLEARRPQMLSDVPTEPDLALPTTRSQPNPVWTMRNDYNVGPQLTTEGWGYFGMPRSRGSMSLFDLLLNTLPDVALLPGASAAGFVFFPEPGLSGAPPPDQLRWAIYDAVTDEKLETVSLPVKMTR